MKVNKAQEDENISIAHITGIQSIEVHNKIYDFNSTMQRLLQELAKNQAPFILDIAYSCDETGLTLTIYYV